MRGERVRPPKPDFRLKAWQINICGYWEQVENSPCTRSRPARRLRAHMRALHQQPAPRRAHCSSYRLRWPSFGGLDTSWCQGGGLWQRSRQDQGICSPLANSSTRAPACSDSLDILAIRAQSFCLPKLGCSKSCRSCRKPDSSVFNECSCRRIVCTSPSRPKSDTDSGEQACRAFISDSRRVSSFPISRNLQRNRHEPV